MRWLWPAVAAWLAAWSSAWSAAAAAAPEAVRPGPVAVPTAAKAVEVAAGLVEPGAKPGQPALHAQERGLAVDRTDPKAPVVVGYVGPSWVVPVHVERPDGVAGPKPLVIDRGTGRLVARAHEVMPMPNPGVVYLGGFQLDGGALRPGDSCSTPSQGGQRQLVIRLDLGQGEQASLTIQPVDPRVDPLRGQAKVERIRFGRRGGRLAVRKYGDVRTQVTAVSDEGLLASAFAHKNPAVLERRVRELLPRLAERPAETMVWPADARPWLSGVDGWVSTTNPSAEVGLWHPEDAGAARGGAQVRLPYAPVFVAARVLHPYELPPDVLTDRLDDARELSGGPAAVDDWVGMERTVEFTAAAGYRPGGQVAGGAAQVRQTAYRARVLDVRMDVRRLLVRCQAPSDEFEKWSADFQKVIEGMKIPQEPVEPIVVPLDPAGYRPN